jgi:hypothetical protein
MIPSELRLVLERLDVEAMRRADLALNPHLPYQTDEQVLTSMHMARTASDAVSFMCRAYSHAWLFERGLPSQLPDELRPRAQRIYPVVAKAVGIACKSTSPHMKEALGEIRGAMEAAVLEAVEDRKLDDSEHVKARMQEARRRTIDKLFG